MWDGKREAEEGLVTDSDDLSVTVQLNNRILVWRAALLKGLPKPKVKTQVQRKPWAKVFH